LQILEIEPAALRGGFFIEAHMTERQMRAFRQFVAAGYTKEGAAALVGNASQESTRDLHSAFTRRTDHGSEGIFQWRLERLARLIEFARERKLDAQLLETQCAFAAHELALSYPFVDHELRTGHDVADLTAKVCWKYECPNRAEANLENRIHQAQRVFADWRKAA
jgi:Phage tail lysozyme